MDIVTKIRRKKSEEIFIRKKEQNPLKGKKRKASGSSCDHQQKYHLTPLIHLSNMNMHFQLCVFVCFFNVSVCERERERKRENIK